MRDFMQHVTSAFFSATGWNNIDNSYSQLDATARDLIDFPLPRGLSLTLSSLANPQVAAQWSLGIVDGSISYLYSSVPVPHPALLPAVRRAHLFAPTPASPTFSVPSSVSASPVPQAQIPQWWLSGAYPNPYTVIVNLPLSAPAAASPSAVYPPTEGGTAGCSKAKPTDRRSKVPPEFERPSFPYLLYGRLYLPRSLLEGLVVKRWTRTTQIQLSAVSEQSLHNGGTILALLQHDRGRFGLEGLASTDGLIGVRGLYNFGEDATAGVSRAAVTAPQAGQKGPLDTPKTPRPFKSSTKREGSASNSNNVGAAPGGGHHRPSANTGGQEKERIYGRFSAGAEIYYGTLDKSGGISLGARFSTLPAHKGSPLTATLTLNPLMGNISATYAVVARRYCRLATRFEFNFYSYESSWAVGIELWRKLRTRPLGDDGTAPNTSESTQRPGFAQTVRANQQPESNAFDSRIRMTEQPDSPGQSMLESPKTEVGPQKSESRKPEIGLVEPKFIEPQIPEPPVPEPKGSDTKYLEDDVHEFPTPPLTPPRERLRRKRKERPVEKKERSVEKRERDEPPKPDPPVDTGRANGISASAAGGAAHGRPHQAGESATMAESMAAGKEAQAGNNGPGEGVLKARLDQSLKVALVWEAPVLGLLCGVGTSIDLRKPEEPFRNLGVSIQYPAV